MQGDGLACTCIIAFVIARMSYYLVPINTDNAAAVKPIQDQFFYSSSHPTASSVKRATKRSVRAVKRVIHATSAYSDIMTLSLLHSAVYQSAMQHHFSN